MGSSAKEVIDYDAIVVGAGLSGLNILHELRQHSFRVKVFEGGSDLGGVWHWNTYPGARTDSEFQIYQIIRPDICSDFPWTQRFPDSTELRRYFHHIDKKQDFRRDIQFSTFVTAAEFNEARQQWLVCTDDGVSTRTSYLILCTGFASKIYTPPFPGLEKFKGQCYHSSRWPEGGVDLVGKRVSVIGTGASGVQLIQEIGPSVAGLTVYQRTPNIALPMQQCSLSDEMSKWKFPDPEEYTRVFEDNLKTFSGQGIYFLGRNAMEDSADERRAVYEDLYKKGGLCFLVANYQDILVSRKANEAAYGFWCEKTRARINDPRKKDILAPKVAPHALGTKLPSLEQSYYEVFNQDNVQIISIRESPITEVREAGVVTQNEGLVETDVLILATGFDTGAGGILEIDIKNGKGETLEDKWKAGILTNLGMATAGFPNMFFMYGPQAPTALANGATMAQIQSDWITNLLLRMRMRKASHVDVQNEAELKWKETIWNIWNSSLFAGTESSYDGSNITGKIREPLNYAGGIPNYIQALKKCSNENYAGFMIS